MRFTKSRPFALSRTQTPTAAALGHAIGPDASLAAAADAWRGDAPLAGSAAYAPLGDEADKAHREAVGDRAYQTFLTPGTVPGGSLADPAGGLSAASATLGGDALQLAGSRASAAFGGQGELASASALALPTATGIKVGGELAGGAELAGLAAAGKGGRYAGLDLAFDGATVGLGATLVTDSKIVLLGPTVLAPDGTQVRLARFKSQVMPVLDGGLAAATDALGVGLRAVVSMGRGATYDKFVPVDQLARMMRQRSVWCRDLVECAAALGVMAGLAAPSRRAMAADLGQVQAMRPGEAVTWHSTKAMVLALSAGSHGLRGSLTGQVRGHAFLRLVRLDGDRAELTVQPVRLLGARLGVEARLAVEAFAEASQVAAKERSWRFDLTLMSARHALSRALDGHLPGLVLPGAPDTAREAYALLATHRAEKLPLGVEALASSFATSQHKLAGLAGVRLPELLGGSSLGASVGLIKTAAAEAEGGRQGRFTRTTSSTRSLALLTDGSVERQLSVGLTSAVSIGPRGESQLRPAQLRASVMVETADSSGRGRRRAARQLAGALGQTFLAKDVRPTRRYTVEVVRTMGIASLEAVAALGDGDVADMARRAGLPAAKADKVLAVVRQAVAGGDEASYARALSLVTSQGAAGLDMLSRLADLAGGREHTYQASVTNDSHDQLLRDFFKAETYALGAKTYDHARQVLRRLEKLDWQLGRAMAELRGDGIMASVMSPGEAERRCAVLEAVQAEVACIRADVLASF